MMPIVSDLPEDLQRLVWHEYIDRLRVRLLHYQLTHKFRHWRSLPMATHAGMVQDITEYRGLFLCQDLSYKHLFIASGWDPATFEWFAIDYVSSCGGPNVPLLYQAAHSNTHVHAAWWFAQPRTSRERLEPPRLVWFP